MKLSFLKMISLKTIWKMTQFDKTGLMNMTSLYTNEHVISRGKNCKVHKGCSKFMQNKPFISDLCITIGYFRGDVTVKGNFQGFIVFLFSIGGIIEIGKSSIERLTSYLPTRACRTRNGEGDGHIITTLHTPYLTSARVPIFIPRRTLIQSASKSILTGEWSWRPRPWGGKGNPQSASHGIKSKASQKEITRS